MTDVVADGALSSEANRQKLAQTHLKWSTRVPATVSAAQAVLAQANPQALTMRHEGYRAHEWTSTYGGIEQRWLLIDSEPRQAQARAADRRRRASLRRPSSSTRPGRRRIKRKNPESSSQ